MEGSMAKSILTANSLNGFSKNYDSGRESAAEQSRGEFIEAFPIAKLNRLRLKDYVIGLQLPTFCDRVEAKTRPWAVIQGSTAIKFGIYFGATKSDPTKKYRFSKKFGTDSESAFRAVRSALLELVKLGAAAKLDFTAIDANPLSQMFKAKILSLYFPEKFINACSGEHLAMIGQALGFGENLPVSQYQNLIVKAKHENALTTQWSNPKFTAFLYRTIVRSGRPPDSPIQKPSKKSHRKVNFEDTQEQRDRIGKAAEAFALKWEAQRLEGAGLARLVSSIEDRRDRPGYGYDFLSHSASTQQRFIEVKAVAKLRGESFRFFLSDNELTVSNTPEHQGEYYFYLVFFGSDGEPHSLRPVLASKMYEHADISPASYTVRFDLENA
jgi:hypothetical protein